MERTDSWRNYKDMKRVVSPFTNLRAIDRNPWTQHYGAILAPLLLATTAAKMNTDSNRRSRRYSARIPHYNAMVYLFTYLDTEERTLPIRSDFSGSSLSLLLHPSKLLIQHFKLRTKNIHIHRFDYVSM